MKTVSRDHVVARVLSIDPGFTKTGYAVFDIVKRGTGDIEDRLIDVGLIEIFRDKKKRGVRQASVDMVACMDLTDGILGLLEKYKPFVAFMEEIAAGSKSARALKSMAFSTATILATLYSHGVYVYLVPILDIKKVIGKSNPSKVDSIRKAVELFPHSDVEWPLKDSREIIDWDTDIIARIHTMSNDEIKNLFVVSRCEHEADAVLVFAAGRRNSDLLKVLEGLGDHQVSPESKNE